MDVYCKPVKQFAMPRAIRRSDAGFSRMREWPAATTQASAKSLPERIERELEELG